MQEAYPELELMMLMNQVSSDIVSRKSNFSGGQGIRDEKKGNG
jgi:hypothetical protein